MKRATIAAEIRTAVKRGEHGRALAVAEFGPQITPLIYEARMVREFSQDLRQGVKPAQRATIEAALADARSRVASGVLAAIEAGDGETLRGLADAIGGRHPAPADPVRMRLLLLKAKIQESSAPNGEPWVCRSLPDLMRLARFKGDARAFRRLLADLKFPYLPPVGGRPKTRTNKT